MSTLLMVPAMLLVGFSAMSYSALETQRNYLQQLVDSAALAGARELYINGDGDLVQSIVTEHIRASHKDGAQGLQVSTSVREDAGEVDVTASIPHNLDIPFIELFGVEKLRAEATAQSMGGGRICVLALDPSGPKGVNLDRRARMTAPTCGVFANSTNAQAIRVEASAQIEAELVCAVGGVKLDKDTNVTPMRPMVGCPEAPDPLAQRLEPEVGECDYQDLVLGDDRPEEAEAAAAAVGAGSEAPPTDPATIPRSSSGEYLLEPGVYCGGLSVGGGAMVRFRSGEYIIKDGPLYAGEMTALRGKGVGFFMTGRGSIFEFTRTSQIDLAAAKTGRMAGLLFFEGRDVTDKRRYKIFSNYAHNLLGTIYLSKGELYIDADAPLAKRSDFTIIVAWQLTLYAGPDLHLNTNYEESEVPVPAGVGPVGAGGVLLKR